MTKDETLSIIQLITTYYPNFKFKQESKEERQIILLAWHQVLQKYDFEETKQNVFDYAEFNSFAPKVADITQASNVASTVATVQETMARIKQEDRERAERQKLIQSPQEQEEIKKLHEQKRAELNLDWNRG